MKRIVAFFIGGGSARQAPPLRASSTPSSAVAICANRVHIRQEQLDHAMLNALTGRSDERIAEIAVDKSLARLRAGQAEHLVSPPGPGSTLTLRV